jgi:hypothetical protein
MDDDRRQEDHSGVEVQHRSNDGLKPQERGQKRNWPSANSLDARTERGKQPVGLNNGADEE